MAKSGVENFALFTNSLLANTFVFPYFEEFKRIIPCKNDFFVERIFSIFDKDKMGTVSLREFVETIQQFSRNDDDAKIAFLFEVHT